MKIIDPHLHLFDLAKGQYHWLKADAAPFWPDKSTISRDFSSADLRLPAGIELAGFVHIEAGFNNQQPWQEIIWLEQTNLLPFRSVASVDLTATTTQFNQTLVRLCQLKSVVGVRHILDDEASALLNNDLALSNLAQVASHNLLFEAQLQGSDNQGMLALARLAQHLPTLSIVLNHGGFPPNEPIQGKQQRLWQQNISELACCPNIYIKASGWEMVNRQYCVDYVTKTLDFLLDNFDQTKIMLASNFPLCLFSNSYHNVWQNYCDLSLSPAILERLVFGNSQRIYHLTMP